ncbi:procollagen-lysine,2-oxoglutarate 5-dioxygenase-like [Bolinopsis microptera]|uniref:Procollagen-lysine 5-dioxygenase n=1 Tax=Bolinopsis infundibulum TaxID=140455 RepID=A0A1S6WN82_9METZ|nr:procollagen-lysine 5-dioxygenase [Bolinopsis infundibulum]
MLLLWLSLVAGVQGLIPVDNDVEPEYAVATDDDESTPSDYFVIFTVATEENDPFQRYVRSLKIFDMDQHLQTLGMNEKWLGGDMNYPGGGFKVNLLKKAMEQYKEEDDMIVMFTDSYDVIFLADREEIVDNFKSTGANFLISAENYIWPDQSLESQYPDIKGKKYLCSGMMMGYATTFWAILNYKEIENTFDDQLYYTHVYLDPNFREKHKIQLDGTSKIFHNLHGAEREIDFGFGSKRVTNWEQGTQPQVLHGNGPTKLSLNRFGNYHPKVFDPTEGFKGKCMVCDEKEGTINVEDTENLPTILTTMFITERTPFIDYFVNKTFTQNYPPEKWHVRIYNRVWGHADHIQELVNYHVTNGDKKFASFELKQPKETISKKISDLYQEGMSTCAELECGFYFVMDSVITLTDDNVLKDLIHWNKSVITTQLTQPGQYWSNFWGDVSKDGFYKRSTDYFNMVKRERLGLWNVAFVNHLVAIRGDVIKDKKVSYVNTKYDDSNYDVGFNSNARKNNVFLYMVNLKEHGHLKRMENYTSHRVHNDLWQIFTNTLDWKLNYIHPDFDKYLTKTRPEFPQPCPDVYHFPLLSTKFSWHIIHELESMPGDIFAGSGKTDDKRLQGGYENVPTVDVHFTQINFQQEWMKLLRDYVAPIQRLVFEGYSFHGNALLSFVVKYHEEGQRELRPHHDHSTFTTNTALNRQGIDYQGGGSYFIRQNCLVRDVDIGWTLMHPGRLTHYHEGKPITQGTRYILVSFNDP